jgi:DNA-directed RNA polymerase specialized sigma24 family protein
MESGTAVPDSLTDWRQAPDAGDIPRFTRALRDGNEDAFRLLHAHWNRRLFRFCFALSAGDEAMAAEITQATYLRAFSGIRELPDEAALWNWLARAARHAAVDHQRRGWRYFGALARFSDWLGVDRAPVEACIVVSDCTWREGFPQ